MEMGWRDGPIEKNDVMCSSAAAAAGCMGNGNHRNCPHRDDIVAFSGWVRSKGTLTLQTGDKKRRPLNGIEGAMHGALEPSVG